LEKSRKQVQAHILQKIWTATNISQANSSAAVYASL